MWKEKNMRKFILYILICGFIVIGTTACSKDKEYTLNIGKLEEISNITIDTLAKEDNIKEFSYKNSINEIYNIFSEKTTNVESVNDNPSNPDILYFIKFNNSKDESNSAYVYKKRNKYYIEQPYNGIYKITEEEYKTIEKIVK